MISSLALGLKMKNYIFLQYLSRGLGKAMAEGTGGTVGVLGLTSLHYPAANRVAHLVGIQQCLLTYKALSEQKTDSLDQLQSTSVSLPKGIPYIVQHLRLKSSRNQKIGKIPKEPLGEMKCGKDLHSNLIESKAIPL